MNQPSSQSAIEPSALRLRACRTCGLVQSIPSTMSSTMRLECPRCGSHLRLTDHARGRSRAAAFALAALILYPPAMLMPVLEIQKMGHTSTATIWSGVVSMLSGGQIVIGLIVLVCSIVVPLLKIGGMLWLCVGSPKAFDAVPSKTPRPHRHRILTYRFIEWIGRWGMVDVLLVSILIAAVKLGAYLQIHAGPGIVAFAGVVVCSLISSALFRPEAIWDELETTKNPGSHPKRA